MIFETESIGQTHRWKLENVFFLKEFKQQLEFNFDELFPFRDTRLKGKFEKKTNILLFLPSESYLK